MIKTTLVKSALVAALSLSVMAPAFAADDTTVAVTGAANVTITNPLAGNFTGVTLDGTMKTTTASLATFSVTDARGTGAGWHVTAQATQFKEIDGTGAYVATGAKLLPTGSLTQARSSVAADGTTSTPPTIPGAAGSTYTIDDGTADTIATAATDTGMGKYDFTPPANALTLTILPNAYAKSYKSDVTISVISGP